MSDIDGDFPTDPADQGSALMSDPILRALVRLEQEVRTELDVERQRADAAEGDLAEARRKLEAAEAELAVAVSRSQKLDEQMFKALGDYLEDNMRAQRGLIDITRQLLATMDVDQIRPVAAEASVVSTEIAEPVVEPAPDTSLGGEAGSAAPIHLVPDPYEWHADVDPITDEHRIIDQSNREDMERLDSPSRLFIGSTAFKRKNLLTGS